MTYKIKIIVLEKCSFSKKALNLLNINKINYELIQIHNCDKDKYITHDISTYPQIYLTKQNNFGNLLLGGYDDLNKFINLFKNIKDKNTFLDNKQNFLTNYPNWSNKATLRLIELINQNNTT